MMRKRIISVIAAAAVLTATVSTGFAYAASDLDSVKSQISSKQEELEKGEQKENELIARIDSLNSQIDEIEQKIAALDSDIEDTKAKISETEAELNETQKNMTEQNDSLNERLRVMYKNGETGILEILLGSASLSEFMTNLDMIQKIYDNDMDVLNQIKEQYEIIENKKNELESLQSQLSRQQEEQQQQKSELDAQKSDVEALKEEVASDNDALEAQIDELNKEAEELTAYLQQQQASSSVSSSTSSKYSGGVMSWPVPGYYTYLFSVRISRSSDPAHEKVPFRSRYSCTGGNADYRCGGRDCHHVTDLQRLRQVCHDRPRRRCSISLRTLQCSECQRGPEGDKGADHRSGGFHRSVDGQSLSFRNPCQRFHNFSAQLCKLTG